MIAPTMTILAASTDAVLQLAVSIGLIAAVIMFIMAVFGQGGKVRISPQRQAALATGHSDRRTVFENPMLRPIMWPLLSISHSLAMPKFKDWVRRTLVAAGSPEFYTVEEYLAVSQLTGLVLGVAMTVLAMLFSEGQINLFLTFLGMAVGTGLGLYQLHTKAVDRLQEISRRVPYALDLVSLAMSAGATFVEAVQTVVRERRSDPFNEELKALLAEMDLGATRRRALENMAARIPLQPLQAIVSSVIQAEELGTPLATVLHAQANLLRMHRSARAEEKAASASVRILVPSLLILISVILAVFAPAILRMISEGGMF